QVVRSFRDFTARLAQAVGVALILLSAFYALFPEIRVSTVALLLSVSATLGVLLPLRALSYGLARRGAFGERILILGRGPLATKIIREIEASSYLGHEIVGIVDNASTAGMTPHAYPLLGPLTHLGPILEETRPNRIIIALSERRARLPVN